MAAPQEQRCMGDGQCLQQTEDGSTYKRMYPCKFSCVPMKCPNFIVCQAEFPAQYLGCWGKTCLNCDLKFGPWQGGKGVLPLRNNETCPICLETCLCITYPKCDHYACISCFRRCFFYDCPIQPPPFPSDVNEDEYDKNPDDPKWQTFESIRMWNHLYDVFEDCEQAWYDSEENLRQCPICRT